MIIEEESPTRFCPRCKISGARIRVKDSFIHERCLTPEERKARKESRNG